MGLLEYLIVAMVSGTVAMAQNLIECIIIDCDSMYKISARLDDGKLVN